MTVALSSTKIDPMSTPARCTECARRQKSRHIASREQEPNYYVSRILMSMMWILISPRACVARVVKDCVLQHGAHSHPCGSVPNCVARLEREILLSRS